MTPNPYESPRPGGPVKEPPTTADPMLQLLVEIRDAQVEMLRLTRDAQQRQYKYRAFPFVMFALSIVLMAFPVYRLWTTARVPPPMPARRVPSPAVPPSLPTTPAPTTFRASS